MHLDSSTITISPTVPARITTVLRDLDPVTQLDRLLVGLRLLAGRPGVRGPGFETLAFPDIAVDDHHGVHPTASS